MCVCLHKIIIHGFLWKLMLNLLKSEILRFSSLLVVTQSIEFKLEELNDALKTSLMIGAMYNLKTSKCFKSNFNLT